MSPKAAVIRVVRDTLNPQTPAAVSQTCAPEEARRLTRKLAFQSTPRMPGG